MGDEILKKIITWDVAPGKEYFDELFRVSRNQIIWGEGWCIESYDFTLKNAWLTVHAWADLEPYGGRKDGTEGTD